MKYTCRVEVIYYRVVYVYIYVYGWLLVSRNPHKRSGSLINEP